jgi:hypothetical protein
MAARISGMVASTISKRGACGVAGRAHPAAAASNTSTETDKRPDDMSQIILAAEPLCTLEQLVRAARGP